MKVFKHQSDFKYIEGWDKYALDYEKLLVPNTVYALTKELLYYVLNSEFVDANTNFRVLDINCGTGNDFPYFLSRNWQIVGCDGSAGMLNKAAERFNTEVTEGKLSLYQGMIENLSNDDFTGEKFDLIFSITGGFSYIDDTQLQAVNMQIAKMLKPNGKIVLGHLTPFSLADSWYRLKTLRNPLYRQKVNLSVNIKGEQYRMYLRGLNRIKRLYKPNFNDLKYVPLLAKTPPYQSGYAPNKATIDRHFTKEKGILNKEAFCKIADQILVVGS